MLQFILGRAKSGKSEYISAEIEQLANKIKNERPNERIILIVPEQFSLEAEKSLFKRLGAKLFSCVSVTSFTRLSEEIFREKGSGAGKYCSDCGKTILMSIALSEVQDNLNIYKKSWSSAAFAASLAATADEFKNAIITSEVLSDAAQNMKDGILKEKLIELNLIFSAYNSLLSQSYLDLSEDIIKAARLVHQSDYFSGCHVFIDGFKGFTAVEFKFIEEFLTGADEVKCALPLPAEALSVNNIGGTLFAPIILTYTELMRRARALSITVKPSIKLETSYYKAHSLSYLERNLYLPIIEKSQKENDGVYGWLCQNEYSEVEFAAATIRRLIAKENYRYDDIAIIVSDDEYLPIIDAAFLKYKIPFYADKLCDISIKPLVRFIENLLECTANGMNIQNILSMLKCDMTSFDVDSVSVFENYCCVWQIKGADMRREFTENPRGFKQALSEHDRAELLIVNQIREFTVSLIDWFRKETDSANGFKLCAAVAGAIQKAGADSSTKRKIKSLNAQSDFAAAEDYASAWELTADMLNTMAAAIGENKLPLRRFADLFSLAAKSYDVGTLPQAADTVIVGQAERIRLTEKKAVFVIGANDGAFPKLKNRGGIFTEREAKELSSLNTPCLQSSAEIMREERFIAYRAATLPISRLYLTARKCDISGSSKGVSEIFAQLEKMFGENCVKDADELPPEYFCVTDETTFAALCKNYFDSGEFTPTVKKLLSAKEEYAARLERLEISSLKKAFKIKDHEIAKELFGTQMRISPTRVESFYGCRFKYFCEHGLRALPLQKAELNPLETGNLIHRILYAVTPKMDFDKAYNSDFIRQLIQDELDRYISEIMGGAQNKTKRFLYLYNRILNSSAELIRRLYDELSKSLFRPSDFECDISQDGEITPLTVYGSDQTVIYVQGKIDRVDSYVDENGQKYVRIVDYKSGSKKFELNDVLNGLNLQMLIYLHCIEKNGEGKYKNALPAGILYMPSGELTPTLDRNAGEDEINGEKYKSYRMNGLLLNDRSVIEAMESPASGIFIPVSLKSDGTFAARQEKSLVSLTQLGKIFSYLEKLIVNMSDSLHRGEIEALPIRDNCTYCSYKSVCGHDNTVTRDYLEYSANDEIASAMEKEVIQNG